MYAKLTKLVLVRTGTKKVTNLPSYNPQCVQNNELIMWVVLSRAIK